MARLTTILILIAVNRTVLSAELGARAGEAGIGLVIATGILGFVAITLAAVLAYRHGNRPGRESPAKSSRQLLTGDQLKPRLDHPPQRRASDAPVSAAPMATLPAHTRSELAISLRPTPASLSAIQPAGSPVSLLSPLDAPPIGSSQLPLWPRRAADGALLPSLRRDLDQEFEREDGKRDLEVLDQLLRDIRDATFADESVFWRWSESRDVLAPNGWSTEGVDRPAYFKAEDWGPLVRWCAEERLVHCAGPDDAPQFAAAPVASRERLYGVLSLSAGIGLGLSREAAKAWLPRYAAQVASFIELMVVRREYGRNMRRNIALVAAMQRLQEHKTAESLAQALCETAQEVVALGGATGASLLRWNAAADSGTVQYASPGMRLDVGAVIAGECLVGSSCRNGKPLVLEDATSATEWGSAYGGASDRRTIGSLVVIPIDRAGQVIGSIVVEGAGPGSITREDAGALELLAAASRGSLEIVWEIEEVARRARTDPLTGLFNRRHFDEQLARVVAETDRFGSPCALILADIDHFKAVNDTHGHDSGDAVLRHVGKTLADAVRTVDICARYGGEEIAILLPQTALAGAIEVAERLRQSVASRPVPAGSGPIGVTLSFGVASYPEAVARGDGLFSAADKALYQAKANGRNCVMHVMANSSETSAFKR